MDADSDDGAQLNPRSCALSTLSILVDATRGDRSAPLYVNAWFDWNQDGDWADGGTRRCSPEWAIQNMRIDPASLGADRVAVLTLRFRAGRVPREFWWRVQVHAGGPVPHLGSGGQATPTSGGETEDWLFSKFPPLRRPLVVLRCSPRAGVIDHGRTHHISYWFGGTGARVSLRRAVHTVTGDRDGIEITQRRDLPNKHDWVFIVKSLAQHERHPWGQHITIQLRVEALVNGRLRSYDARCGVGIFHVRRVQPPVPPPRELKPPPRRQASADLRVEARIDTAYLDRNGQGRVSGSFVVTNLGPGVARPFRLLISSNRPDAARATEVVYLSCSRTETGTECMGPEVARDLSLGYGWAMPVSGPGRFTATFEVLSPTTDPQPANNRVTVETELRLPP